MVKPRSAATASAAGKWRSALFVLGELLITAGLVLLLFVFYAVHVTDWFAAQEQAAAGQELQQRWQRAPDRSSDRQVREPRPPAAPEAGAGFARLHMPTLDGTTFAVLEGTDRQTLAAGPGHYPDTALPGEPGNFGIAGHRIGNGAPFNELDALRSCDALVVETADSWFVYQVLPMPHEAAGWDERGADPRCAGVRPLPPPYDRVAGRHVVDPARADVLNPVPGAPPEPVTDERAAPLITLTTCHPAFSNRQRLIVHGVLTGQHAKRPDDPSWRPAQLRES